MMTKIPKHMKEKIQRIAKIDKKTAQVIVALIDQVSVDAALAWVEKQLEVDSDAV